MVWSEVSAGFAARAVFSGFHIQCNACAASDMACGLLLCSHWGCFLDPVNPAAHMEKLSQLQQLSLCRGPLSMLVNILLMTCPAQVSTDIMD